MSRGAKLRSRRGSGNGATAARSVGAERRRGNLSVAASAAASRATAALAVLAGLLSACASARRGEPLRGAFTANDASVARGEVVFARHCHACHPGGEAGLGLAIHGKGLPAFLVRFQVRNGLGAMPAFDAAVLPPEQLDDLLAFLDAHGDHGD